jgi:hypothetical protein
VREKRLELNGKKEEPVIINDRGPFLRQERRTNNNNHKKKEKKGATMSTQIRSMLYMFPSFFLLFRFRSAYHPIKSSRGQRRLPPQHVLSELDQEHRLVPLTVPDRHVVRRDARRLLCV